MAITNEKIEQMMASIQELKAAKEQEIEELRVKWLGKKGEITQLFDEFRTVDKEQKREFGQRLNALKNAAAAKIDEMRALLSEMAGPASASFDMTKPGDIQELG
ncbi:MAG: phenylalanine--tRNA ligase subunit alpha, partial [Bacteroidales bacterium]|nr:phenylalanine--tRNA ligase subunit alpha [Bacteroidales bacterium]